MNHTPDPSTRSYEPVSTHAGNKSQRLPMTSRCGIPAAGIA